MPRVSDMQTFACVLPWNAKLWRIQEPIKRLFGSIRENIRSMERIGTTMEGIEIDSGEKAIIILQSLICYLREKNVLTRADIEELKDRVDTRIAAAENTMPAAMATAAAASREMANLEQYCGKRYGGKHRKSH